MSTDQDPVYPAYGPPPLDTFVPAPGSGLVAWVADRGGRNTRVPVVGYFVGYGRDGEDGPLTPDVEPAVMVSNGWVCSLRDFTSTGPSTLIGVYPVGVDPAQADPEQYVAAHRNMRSHR